MLKRNLIIGLTTLIICVSFVDSIKAKCEPIAIASYDYKILKPYLSGMDPYANHIYNKKYLKDRPHPLLIGMATLYLLREAHHTNERKVVQLAKEYLEFLSNEQTLIDKRENSILWKYNFKWNELEPGWWSSLANSVIALSFLSAWQEFGLKRYKDIADKAINGVILPIEKGGSALWLDENSCWFSEYAHKNLTKDNEYYVLNGFLLSLLTVRIYADVTGDEKIRKMYECGLNGLKKIYLKFYNNEVKWTYYMLNPLTPEAAHYLIYEMVLYESLYKLTDNDFYLQQLTKHRDFFEEQYPLDLMECNDGVHFLFSLIGPPNPYWLDTYPIRIEFLDGKGEIVEIKESAVPRNRNIPIKERAFIYGRVKKTSYKYKIYACFGKSDQLLYEGLIEKSNKHLINGRRLPESIKYKLVCSYDAECQDNLSAKILPSKITVPENKEYYSNNQGILDFSVSLLNLKKYKYFGFVINPTENLRSIRFRLYDSNGNSVQRYYVELQGKVNNLIILHLSGFKGKAAFKPALTKIISLVIPTSGAFHVNDFNVTIKKFLGFRNNVELYNFVRNEEFFFPEQPY
jgi:hypothetical protein